MPPEPAANSELDADLEAAANAAFTEAIQGSEGENVDPDPNASPTGGEGAGSDPSGSVGSDPNLSSSTATEEWQWDDGYKLTKAQARSYAELEAFLFANPDKAEGLARYLRGEATTDKPTKAGSVDQHGSGDGGNSQTPEINLDDITDPEIRAVLETQQKTIADLEALRQEHSSIAEYVTTQQEEHANALMNRATTSFKEQHKLSDEEMTRLTEVTARLNILPGLMGPVDPISGLPRNVDPLAAIEEALSTAYWQIPEFRDRAISEVTEANTASKARKAKISSLQGSSGSVSREAPVPKNETERRQAMIAEVASAMGRE